jgi:hypothetical protein
MEAFCSARRTRQEFHKKGIIAAEYARAIDDFYKYDISLKKKETLIWGFIPWLKTDYYISYYPIPSN